jgi:hypothetical protein
LGHCPLCESRLAVLPPTVAQIERSLRQLSEQLEAVEAENPRLQFRLAALLREEAELQARLQENQQRIASRMRENEILRVQQENFILQARTMGKISQYVETASSAESSSTLRAAIEAARVRVAVLEQELDPEAIREKLSAFLNIIGRYMTTYSEALELEHRGSQLRLDIRNLTVVADTLDGPVPLFRMEVARIGSDIMSWRISLCTNGFARRIDLFPALLFLISPPKLTIPRKLTLTGRSTR